jgi:hypothetical protein
MKLDIYPTAALHPGTAPVAQATGRTRLRSYADENGFVAAEAGPDADVDEFVRGDRIVHIRYGPDERITDVLVNGQSLFNREHGVAAHHATMAARQRTGIGLTYGDDGHWIADHLHGAEKARAEARADRAWARTHRYCPQSTRVVDNPAGRLVIYRCPECGQDVGLDATGSVLPHSVWIAAVGPR